VTVDIVEQFQLHRCELHKYNATIKMARHSGLCRFISCLRQRSQEKTRARRGRDRMAVGFTTTYAIGAYHH
jgi:hypothetical protein